MKGQKEAVVEEVKLAIPGFIPYKDNALLILSAPALENIKANIMNGILNGVIEYGKDPNIFAEVRAYARSMVMNHLKKARELNGGHAFVKTATATTGDVDATGTSKPQVRTVRTKVLVAPKGVNASLLPDDLREFATKLV